MKLTDKVLYCRSCDAETVTGRCHMCGQSGRLVELEVDVEPARRWADAWALAVKLAEADGRDVGEMAGGRAVSEGLDLEDELGELSMDLAAYDEYAPTGFGSELAVNLANGLASQFELEGPWTAEALDEFARLGGFTEAFEALDELAALRLASAETAFTEAFGSMLAEIYNA